jgi:hypothetical protein
MNGLFLFDFDVPFLLRFTSCAISYGVKKCVGERRLLSVWSLVMDTRGFVQSDPFSIFGSFLSMAMSMVHPFVAQVVLTTKSSWNDVVGFQDVTIFKVESTSWTLSFLKGEKLCFLAPH